MDPLTILALVRGASEMLALGMRAAERMRQSGEMTKAQFDAVKLAGAQSDAQVDAILAAAKARVAAG